MTGERTKDQAALYMIQDHRGYYWTPTDWPTTLRLVRTYRRQVRKVVRWDAY